MADLERLRLKVRSLLHFSDPADALYVYYAFYHDPRRTRLYVRENDAGHAEGFAAVCQTGQRLFQPIVVLHAAHSHTATDLLREALLPGRPYYLITRPGLKKPVGRILEIEQSGINRTYRLDLSRVQFSINVLVVAEQGANGLPRFIIRSQGEVAAEAGLNWTSPHFAELFVRTTPAAHGRGWAQVVLAACTTWAVQSGRQPVYIVGEDDEANIALAEKSGYVDTGAREFVVEGMRR